MLVSRPSLCSKPYGSQDAHANARCRVDCTAYSGRDKKVQLELCKHVLVDSDVGKIREDVKKEVWVWRPWRGESEKCVEWASGQDRVCQRAARSWLVLCVLAVASSAPCRSRYIATLSA